jgi:hypothetical protein
MTEQLIIADAWKPVVWTRDESVRSFAERVIDGHDWAVGDTLTIAAEHGHPTVASGATPIDSDLVVLQADAAPMLQLLLRRLLGFGFGRIAFAVNERGQLLLTRIELQIRPELPSTHVQTFLAGLKAHVLPQLKEAYQAWWTPGQMNLTVRYDKDGKLEAGHLTLSI